MSHSSELLNPRRGSWEPLIYTWLVRSTRGNLVSLLTPEPREAVCTVAQVSRVRTESNAGRPAGACGGSEHFLV